MTSRGWISTKYKDLLEIDKQSDRFLFTREDTNCQNMKGVFISLVLRWRTVFAISPIQFDPTFSDIDIGGVNCYIFLDDVANK